MDYNKIKKGESGVLVLPAWDVRVRMLPHKATISIPALQVTDLPASIKATGEIFVHLPAEKFQQVRSITATWTLYLPTIGNQVLQEDADPYNVIQIEEKYDVVESLPAARPNYFPNASEVREGTLKGIPLVDSDGFVFPDESIDQAIQAAAQAIARICNVEFCKPDGTPKTVSSIQGATADLHDEPYAYDAEVFRNYGFTQLQRRPVQNVTKVEIRIGDSPVFSVPAEWINVYQGAGQINLVPNNYSSVLGSAYGLLFPIYGRVAGRIPAILHVEYTVGMPVIPDDMRRAIIWLAAYDILNTVSDSTTAGLASQSISVDGISQSLATTNSSTNSTYGANQLFLQKMLDKWLKNTAASHRGITLTVA